ncbi:DUF4893 domain-containing protein [Paracoccus aminophilus]|uniref:DUF4893 domain-containing protein n=1 Tax=Paracoccus aminophilus JCM 7686 TaxID=1367847 RepID=S5XN18_PARAH|nr:DUF4893 domain-containing protein [Paracoccus aminophilus]AGT08684.1 hypothetical protein JCM7686_1583 [Paracoccus aminophilus JCM 7686]
MFRVWVGGIIPAATVAVLSLIDPALATEARQNETLPDGTAIRAEDVARLSEENLLEVYGSALRQVLQSADSATLGVVTSALRGAPLPADDAALAALAGDWQCNMTKLGGIAPAVVYPPFRCRITADGNALAFEKLSGSQLTRGTLHRDGDRILYLGVDYIRGDTPPSYAEMPATIPDPAARSSFPDVGILEILSPKQARIVLPQPYLESTMNVLSLSR